MARARRLALVAPVGLAVAQDPTPRPTPAPTTTLAWPAGAAWAPVDGARPPPTTHDGGAIDSATHDRAPTAVNPQQPGPRPRNLLQRPSEPRERADGDAHTKPTTAVPTTAAPIIL